MTDESEFQSDSASRQSYRVCSACGCLFHQSRDCCPECGAYPGEEHSPSADLKLNLILSILLGLILCAALYALSRNRDQAAKLEKEKFSRITLSESGQGIEAILPQPTPTPRPVATPVPVLPTPVPFNPDDFKSAPTPEPRPTATPLPRIIPTATPVPEPTRLSTLDLKDQLADEYRKKLEEQLPLAKVGEYIRLTLQDNRPLSGTITRLENNQLALQSSSGIQWVPFRQLSRKSRMKVDHSEREAWIEEQALQEVLKQLHN